MEKYNIDDEGISINNLSSSLEIYKRDIEMYKVFTKEEEQYYINLYIETKRKDIFDFIISSNLRLALSIASKYTNDPNELMDLIQVGNLALMRALEKYELSFNTKFSTYATRWIRANIARHILTNYNTIKLPNYIVKLLRRMSNYKNELLLTLNREPTDKEYMKKLGISLKGLKRLYYIEYYKYLISYDQAMDADEDLFIKDIIPNENNQEVDAQIIIECEKEVIGEALKRLTKRENIIIRSRYGLNGQKRSLHELGREFNVTHSAISVSEKNILQQLSENPILRSTYLINGEITSSDKTKQILYLNINLFNEQEIKVLELTHGLYGYHTYSLDKVAEALQQKREIILTTKNRALKKVGLFN